jgi:PAS domain S-box-containing protein
MRRLIPGIEHMLTLMDAQVTRMDAELTRIQAKCLFDAAPVIVPDKPAIIIPEIQLANEDRLCKAIDQSLLDWITGPDFQNFRVSPNLTDYTGYPVSKFRGSKWVELVHPADRDRVRANYQQSCEAPEKPFCITYRLRGKDGRYRWVIDHGAPRYRRRGRSFAGHIGKVEIFPMVMPGAA